MKLSPRALSAAWMSALCASLAGCLLKPNTVATRSYVLSPLPASAAVKAGDQPAPPIGVGLVKLPSYLLKTSLAVRSGSNEITYLDSSLWAERLDTSFQRTLAANLSTLLPTDQIRLSSWSHGEVVRAVYVNVDRFDVDVQGNGTLTAWWRITAGSGGATLKSGESHFTQPGPLPSSRPDAIATTLSALNTRLSETLAQALRESLAGNAGKP